MWRTGRLGRAGRGSTRAPGCRRNKHEQPRRCYSRVPVNPKLLAQLWLWHAQVQQPVWGRLC